MSLGKRPTANKPNPRREVKINQRRQHNPKRSTGGTEKKQGDRVTPKHQRTHAASYSLAAANKSRGEEPTSTELDHSCSGGPRRYDNSCSNNRGRTANMATTAAWRHTHSRAKGARLATFLFHPPHLHKTPNNQRRSPPHYKSPDSRKKRRHLQATRSGRLPQLAPRSRSSSSAPLCFESPPSLPPQTGTRFTFDSFP